MRSDEEHPLGIRGSEGLLREIVDHCCCGSGRTSNRLARLFIAPWDVAHSHWPVCTAFLAVGTSHSRLARACSETLRGCAVSDTGWTASVYHMLRAVGRWWCRGRVAGVARCHGCRSVSLHPLSTGNRRCIPERLLRRGRVAMCRPGGQGTRPPPSECQVPSKSQPAACP